MHMNACSLDMSVWMHICPSFHPQSYWWQFQSQYTGNGRTCCWSELQIRCLLLASKPLQALPCLYSCGNEEPSRRQVEQGPGWGQGEGTRVRQQAGKLTRGSGYIGDRSGSFGRLMKMWEMLVCTQVEPLSSEGHKGSGRVTAGYREEERPSLGVPFTEQSVWRIQSIVNNIQGAITSLFLAFSW